MLKKILLPVLIFWMFLSEKMHAQINFTASPTGYVTPCPSNNVCNGVTYLGAAIQMRYSNQGDTDIEFKIRKCDTGNPAFNYGGTAYMKEGSTCGIIADQNAFVSGITNVSVFVPIDYWHSGTKNFYATTNSDDGYKYFGGMVSVTKTCPDYAALPLTISAASIQAGTNFTVDCPIQNTGNITGNPDKVKFYLSSNVILDANDVYLGQNIMSNLAAGASVVESDNFTIPPGTTAGGYYILARVDPDNTSDECDEFNNNQASFINITSLPPTLQFSQCISAPLIINQNQNLQVSAQLQNIGSASWTGDIKVVVVSNTDIENYQVIYEAFNQTINSFGTFSINNGASITLSAGLYKIFIAYDNAPINGGEAYVNPGACAPIYNYGSGYSTHYQSLLIQQPTPAELTFDQCISAPVSVPQNQNLTVTTQVRNTGSLTWTGEISVVMYKFNNTSEYQELYSQTGITIPGGAVFNINTGNDIVGVTTGAYRILVAYTNAPVNGGNAYAAPGSCSPVQGYGDGLSSHFGEISVTSNPSGFSLALASGMSFSPDPLQIGVPSAFTVSVRNTGNVSWTGSFFLKVNGITPPEDLGGFTVPANNIPVPLTYTFTPNIVHAGQGVTVELFYLTSGNTTGVPVPPSIYQNPITVNINSNSSACTSFGDLPSSGEIYQAAQCLCNLGYIQPQSGTNNVNPNSQIYRADLAKLVYLLTYKGNNGPSPAEDYPVPFDDLQNENYNSYYRYAKALSYLEYDDGIAPFDRDQINFRPYDPIEKKYALKVILEAIDIAPDNSSPGICAGINPGDDAYGYVQAARVLNWFTCSDPNAFITRGEVFLILYKVLNHNGQSCNPDNPIIATPVANDYFIPGNFTSRNMGRDAGYAEGYFPAYAKTSFSIPGTGMNMLFAHSYHSKLTEIPAEFMPLKPLGEGWTHNYNAYILETPGWTQGSETQPARIFIFWPDGRIHMYDKATLHGETTGVFDILTAPNASTYQVVTKSQVTYSFTRYDSNKAVGGKIWMMTQVKDRNENQLNIHYVQSGGNPRINYVIDDHERKLNFAYHTGSNSDKIFSVQDIAGSRIIYFPSYSEGNLMSYKNPRNYLTTYQYETAPSRKHLLTHITLPEGNVITNAYNNHRKLQSTQVGSAAPTIIDIQSNYANLQQSVTSTVTDPEGNIIQHSYDKAGALNSLVSGGNSIQMDYDGVQHPNLPSAITYNGYETQYTYDERGNVTDILLDPQGLALAHHYTYTLMNDVATYTDPRNYTTEFHYDGNGNLDYIEDASGFNTDVSINDQGLMTSLTNPENITFTFNYWPTGDLKEVINPLGLKTSMSYDAVGRVTEIVNPNNQVTGMEYNATDFISQVTNVLSSGNIITQYVYDKNDLLREVENGRGYKTLMTYTNRDLLKTVTFGNDTEMYDYRNDNLLDKITKPDGSLFQMVYDALGRVENDGFAGYDYDDQDNVTLIEVNGSNKPLTMTYDNVNRLASVTYNNKTITYDHDENSNITRITYPGNTIVIDYVYDPTNRLTHVKQGGDDLARYYYRQDGLVDSVWYQNGTNSRHYYDNAGRLTGLSNKKSDGQVINNYLFVLDNNGNHLQEIKTEPYALLTPAATVQMSSFNAENEVNNVENTTFQFDPDGNQIAKGNVTYAWNNADQMTGYGNKNFEYDATGLLRKATRNGQITQYTWDMTGIGHLLMESDASGNPVTYYVYGLGLVCRIKAVGNVKHFYHHDFRGSTIALTNTAQSITHQYQYGTYGEVFQKSEADNNPFRFIGKYGVMYEGDSLYYMRERWYDAATGRFLSEDPVWSTNLYAYAGGNPVMRIDPEGRAWVEDFAMDVKTGLGLFGNVNHPVILGLDFAFNMGYHASNRDKAEYMNELLSFVLARSMETLNYAGRRNLIGFGISELYTAVMKGPEETKIDKYVAKPISYVAETVMTKYYTEKTGGEFTEEAKHRLGYYQCPFIYFPSSDYGGGSVSTFSDYPVIKGPPSMTNPVPTPMPKSKLNNKFKVW